MSFKQNSIKESIIIDESKKYLLDLYSWFIDGSGYATGDKTINYKKERVKLHQLIIGKAPKGLCIDHINRNKLDNRAENLRIVSYSLNITNRFKRKDSKQPAKGIQLLPSGSFSVKVVGGKRIGTFKNLEEAELCYKNYLFTKFNINI